MDGDGTDRQTDTLCSLYVKMAVCVVAKRTRLCLMTLIYTCGEFLLIPALGELAIEDCSLPSLWKKEETGHFRVISKKATRLAL